MRRALPVLTSSASRRAREVAEDSVRGGVLATARAAGGGLEGATALPQDSSGAVYPRNALWNALRAVDDPEFPISIVDLGLVVDVRRNGDGVEVDLTYTATACPCMDFIRQDARDRLLEVPGVSRVVINDVWQPAWTRARMTAKGRAALRRCGVAA